MQAKTDPVELIKEIKNMIKVSNLTHYYNKDLALQNINLEIKKAEFVAIIGESGEIYTFIDFINTFKTYKWRYVFLKIQNYKEIKDIDSFRKNSIGFIFSISTYLINYLSVKENYSSCKWKSNKWRYL